MTETIIGWLNTLSWVWTLAIIVAQWKKHFDSTGKAFRVAVQLHLWLWPIAGPALLLHLTRATMHGQMLSVVGDLLMLWAWWEVRDWPDDHFKRRRKKIKDAVKVVGGRLVVKAAPA